MNVLITGGSGFIAVNLIQKLLEKNINIIALDNLSRGSVSYVERFMDSNNFIFKNVDLANLESFRAVIEELSLTQAITHVWHLAANSDIPAGNENINVDLKDTFMTTLNTIKIMEEYNIKNILFASSSAVYGDHGDVVLTEDCGPLLPISNYGAMKLASEALISSATEKFLESALIFRFPNVVGVPATHGVILDFMTKLRTHIDYLDVLGDGTQQKGYLHVEDLVDAMLLIQKNIKSKIEIFNIGPVDAGITVRRIAEETVLMVAPNAELRFGKGNKGWVGDVPKFRYSIKKTQDFGWKPRMGSLAAIQKAIKDIAKQEKML